MQTFGDDKQKVLDRQTLDARLQTLLDEMEFIQGTLGDFDRHAGNLSAILRQEGDPARAAEIMADLQRDRDGLVLIARRHFPAPNIRALDLVDVVPQRNANIEPLALAASELQLQSPDEP